MYDIIPFLIIIVSLILILFIIVKKFPTLSSLNVEDTTKEKQTQLHEKIVTDRIKRRLGRWAGSISIPFVKNIFTNMNSRVKSFHERLVNLEKKHRFIFSTKKITKPEKLSKEEIILEEAKSLFDENKLGEAEKKYIEAIKTNPQSLKAYGGLGVIYMQLDQLDQAKEVFEYVIKFDESNYSAYLNLGDISFKKGDFDVAREYYLKSLKLNPHNLVTLVGLYESCRELDYNEEALSYIKEAVNIEPNSPKYLDYLIESSLALKDKSLAENSLEKLREVNPDNKKVEEYKKMINKLAK
jgi:tetratricopeptide (TPR) repeat protein